MPGAADGGDQDVGLAGDGGEVGGAGVADRDRAVLPQQQAGHRLADDGAAPDDHRPAAGEGDAVALEQGDDAGGGRRGEPRLVEPEAADVDRVEAVDVLVGIDAVEHPLLVDLPGERELHQDAVDRVLGVELVEQGEELVLGGLGGEPEGAAQHADLGAALDLAAHVGLGGGIVADQHGDELRRPGARREHLADACRHLGADLGGGRLAVQDVAGEDVGHPGILP